jgi:hypothetical protein
MSTSFMKEDLGQIWRQPDKPSAAKVIDSTL